jgi:hypothetical protein
MFFRVGSGFSTCNLMCFFSASENCNPSESGIQLFARVCDSARCAVEIGRGGRIAMD